MNENKIRNEIKEDHRLQLKAPKFVLSAENNSKLQSNGTVKLILYPYVTEKRTLRKISFSLTFHASNTNSMIQ